jgi:hypothetical protein
MPKHYFEPIDCESVGTPPSSEFNDGNIPPGNYPGIQIVGQKSLFMQPGLYCLTGDFDVGAQATVEGYGVTIYLKSGRVDIKGGATVILTAPTDDNPDPAIKNLLIYAAQNNVLTHSIEGNGSSRYTGTIYAPDGHVKIGGTTSILPTYTTQVIAHSITVHGDANLNLMYDDDLIWHFPAYLDLKK